MDSPAALFALRWLIVDTFRQTVASRVFWILLSLSLLCTIFCLGVSIEGVGVQLDGREIVSEQGVPLTGPTPTPARMSLLFGLFRVQIHRDAEAEIRLLQAIFGTWIAGNLGVLMTLTLTAGFLPEFLQPASASVLLTKPVPRWLLLLGKYLGMVLFVALHAVIFFGGTWLALGLRTGVWLNAYLLGIPLFILHFAAVYSFSLLLAVTFRSTTACVLGGVLFWAMCYGLNYGRHAAVAYPALAPGNEPLPALSTRLIETAYWLLPKPADLILLLEEALGASNDKVTLSSLPEFAEMLKMGEYHPLASVVSSLLFAAVMLAVSAYQLGKTDY